MKHIGKPAWQLTADCIWKCFQISGKRHLLLTGSRGSGKTTLLEKLTDHPLPGITTGAVPGEAVFLRENGTDREVRIGLFAPLSPGPENRMKPFFYGFAALGIPTLNRCAAGESQWVSIDEVGYLELSCPEYCQCLLGLMEQKQLIAAVRKQELPFLQTLIRREDVFLIDLDDPFGSAGCVIMASGLGKRFGGNKLMAPFRGQPLIASVLDATDGLFAQRIVVTRHDDVAQYARQRGIETCLHQLPFRSDTVRLGLEGMDAQKRCMFCPGDQPLLTRETVMALLLCAQNAPETIWRTACGDTPGAPILFPQWCYPELQTLPEGKGGSYLAKQHPECVRFLNVEREEELRDVDTREELARLELW